MNELLSRSAEKATSDTGQSGRLRDRYMVHILKKLIFLLFIPWVGVAQEVGDTLVPGDIDTTYYEPAEEEYAAATYERPPYHPSPLEPMEARRVEQQRWDEATRELDYSKDVPEPPKERKSPGFNFGQGFDWTAATQGWGSFLQGLAVVAALVAIGYGIWRMLQAPRNRQIARDGVEITVDNLEAYLHESDLERFLREALAQGNYALAVRLYYLQIIKSLSEKNLIRWSREKTNRDYLRELRGHPLAGPLRAATTVYEKVWYGNQALSAEEYGRLEPELKGVLAGI